MADPNTAPTGTVSFLHIDVTDGVGSPRRRAFPIHDMPDHDRTKTSHVASAVKL